MILKVKDENRENYEEILEKYFEDLAMYPDSDVTVILDSENFKCTKILSAYRIQQGSELLFEERGIWSEETGIQFTDRRVNSRRRMNLRGKVLKVIFVVIFCRIVSFQLIIIMLAIIFFWKVKNPEEKYNYMNFNDKRVLAITRSNYIWINQMAYAMNSRYLDL